MKEYCSDIVMQTEYKKPRVVRCKHKLQAMNDVVVKFIDDRGITDIKDSAKGFKNYTLINEGAISMVNI